MHNTENSNQNSNRPERAPIFEPFPPRSERVSQAGDPTKTKPSSKVKWDVITPRTTVIKAIGVGGGGCNAVESMCDEGFEAVEFYAINTDYQALQRCRVPNRIQIGEKMTNGSGAGAMPNVGEQAAREAEGQIREILAGADMVFIAAGMGGGTGTGAAPVIAEIAREMDILNVAIVTKPFQFEGMQRQKRALEGIRKLSENVDTMITILNDKLMEAVGPKTPLTEAFDVANAVLGQGIRAISDLIALPGLINVDFRDLRTIMGETGGAVMGVGIGKGENRAVEAVKKACSSPLQEKIVISGARGVLINITGPPTMTMHEINEATSLVYEEADPEANVIFGVVIDETMQDAMRVTIIATGFGSTDGPESFGNGHEEKLKPRVNRFGFPSHTPNSGSAMSGDNAYEPDKPAIFSKRERTDNTAAPKIDFSAPENPLLNWSKPVEGISESENANGELAGMKSAVLSDSDPLPNPTAEDPYEIPALHRRRRQRFFE